MELKKESYYGTQVNNLGVFLCERNFSENTVANM